MANPDLNSAPDPIQTDCLPQTRTLLIIDSDAGRASAYQRLLQSVAGVGDRILTERSDGPL